MSINLAIEEAIVNIIQYAYPEGSTNYIQNDVDYYSIIYKSIYKGEEVHLSGLVLMPRASNGVLTHYQYHHGTLYPFEDYDHTGSGATDAPSLYDKDGLQSEDQYEVCVV